MGRVIVGMVITLVGVGMLFNIDVFKYIVPVFIIMIGLRMLSGRSRTWQFPAEETNHEDEINKVAVFSAINQKILSNDFKSGKVVAVFGGGEIDLSEVKTQDDRVELELVAVFGGLKVRIPKNWKVKSEAVGIIGGFDNRTRNEKADIVVHVKGVAMMGGVEITN
jgi:hypothetical protein